MKDFSCIFSFFLSQLYATYEVATLQIQPLPLSMEFYMENNADKIMYTPFRIFVTNER